LSARDVTKVYALGEQELRVLSGVSLDVSPGELLCICGASGAGKSTLLHILGALDNPTAGSVVFKGEAVGELGEARKARLRNRAFGFVFQFFHLLPDFTALENVALPRLIDGRRERLADARGKATQVLARVGLAERLNHRPSQLSGGERQRVAIARALVNEPEVLFCDEPTGNLDSKTSAEILRVIVQLNASLGLTVIVVTHDEQIARHTPRIVRLEDGRVTADERFARGVQPDPRSP
jgi:lipoprotein-releasing system ATP-binding protein